MRKRRKQYIKFRNTKNNNIKEDSKIKFEEGFVIQTIFRRNKLIKLSKKNVK